MDFVFKRACTEKVPASSSGNGRNANLWGFQETQPAPTETDYGRRFRYVLLLARSLASDLSQGAFSRLRFFTTLEGHDSLSTCLGSILRIPHCTDSVLLDSSFALCRDAQVK